MTVFLDCDLMKHPNSGLYHYCLNLGTYIDPLLRQNGDRMGFFVPRSERNSFGPGAYRVIEGDRFRNFFIPFLKTCTIWHAPFQTGRIYPDKKRHPHIRVLLTIHDLNALHEGKPPEEQKNSLARTQSLIDQSDAIICISDFCRKDVLTHCKVGSKPIYVIHNGTHKVHDAQMGIESYRPQRPFLFGMGYVNSKKNYHVLVPLLKNENIEMVIAGRLDEPDYIARIKKMAEKMGVADRLHLLGPVSEGEKGWYFRNCMAFVHPSLAEGFGAPVVEAMQFGKPLFLSSLTSLPEIAGDAAYYFRSFNEDHLIDVFEKGMKAYSMNGMANKIREKAKEYNWQEKAKEYLSVYYSLAQ